MSTLQTTKGENVLRFWQDLCQWQTRRKYSLRGRLGQFNDILIVSFAGSKLGTVLFENTVLFPYWKKNFLKMDGRVPKLKSFSTSHCGFPSRVTISLFCRQLFWQLFLPSYGTVPLMSSQPQKRTDMYEMISFQKFWEKCPLPRRINNWFFSPNG